jgi:hypothetical protein
MVPLSCAKDDSMARDYVHVRSYQSFKRTDPAQVALRTDLGAEILFFPKCIIQTGPCGKLTRPGPSPEMNIGSC